MQNDFVALHSMLNNLPETVEKNSYKITCI